MAAFFIGSLSIIGLPPCGGTWSKWYLMIGTIEAGKLILMVVLMASSLLNIAYLLPIPIKGFLYSDPDDADSQSVIREAPLPSLAALCLTAAGCIVLFIYPQPLYELGTHFLEAAGVHGR
jgi:multicomponent Na+:H+ antiporter subunit D